jgi:hypothetical protein
MAIQWSSWASLGKPAESRPLGRPVVQRNQDGRLEVFALGFGEIFNIAQVAPNGGWGEGWLYEGRPLPRVPITAHLVGRNADGRQEIFAIGDDGALWQKWQKTPNGGWSNWSTLGGPVGARPLTGLAVGRNQDGRQEVFVIGSDDNAWQIWQTAPNGGWSDWAKLGQPAAGIRPSDRITVTNNADGRQELFVMGGDNALWHIWQVAPNVGWTDWASLGKPRDTFDGSEPPKDRDLSEPIVQRNADGHLEVFCPGNGAFCNRWQESPGSNVWRHEGWNAKPSPGEGVGIVWLDAALNFTNHLEVFALADDGALWHAWQIDVAPFWSKWESLGSPSSGIQAADRLTIGTNQDGRLEVFVADQDGAVWHIWQVR